MRAVLQTNADFWPSYPLWLTPDTNHVPMEDLNFEKCSRQEPKVREWIQEEKNGKGISHLLLKDDSSVTSYTSKIPMAPR